METTPTKPTVAVEEHEEAGLVLEETPEEKRKDPWTGVLARHESASNSQVSLDLPGAFVSVPASPSEEKGQ